MGGRDYIQLTVRLPPKVYQRLEQLSREWSLTMQDTIVVVLLDYLGFLGESVE